MNNFDLFIKDQVIAIRLLLKEELIRPLLMLLYSTIDILGFVTDTKNETRAGSRFQYFVKKYMVKYLDEISAEDLWGARCGLLHANCPDSDFSRKGKAKEVLYSLGAESHKFAKKVLIKSGKSDKYVNLQIEDLLKSLSKAIDDIKQDMGSDDGFAGLVNKRADMFYRFFKAK